MAISRTDGKGRATMVSATEPPAIVEAGEKSASESQLAFAPEQLVPRSAPPQPRRGAPVERRLLYGEGKFFHLFGLYSGGKQVGIDWRTAKNPKTAIVAAITSVDGAIAGLFGRGSPRIANVLRNRPYLQPSPPGGRVDHAVEGADGRPLGELEAAVRIGVSEIREETGATVVDNLFGALDPGWVPTSAAISSEADRPVGAIVDLPSAATSVGDGGSMEIVGNAGVVLPLDEALRLLRAGRINEAARYEVYLRELLESLGHSIELGRFIGAPAEGAAIDPTVAKNALARTDHPAVERETPPEHVPVIEQVIEVHRVDDDHLILHLLVDHARREGEELVKLGTPHQNMLLHTNYDLVKYVEYYVDPLAGPMVKLRDVDRPAHEQIVRDVGELKVRLPFEGEDPKALIEQAARMDTSAIARAALEAEVTGEVVQLGAPDVASAGQSDLQYHFFGVKVAKPRSNEGFVPLSSALEECAGSEAATKAVLYRLADQLGWLCTKNTSVANVAKSLGIDASALPRLM